MAIYVFPSSMFSGSIPINMCFVNKNETFDKFSDERLLAAHLNGQLDAMRVLVSRYKNELIGYLGNFLRSRTLAEDVFQETFLQVHISARKFNLSKSFKPWLYAIATNKARDAYRKRTRQPTISLSGSTKEAESVNLLSFIKSEEDGVDSIVSNQENQIHLLEVLDSMPFNYKEIIVLCYLQRLKYAQISEILNIPLGTVKSRLHSAIALLSKECMSRVKNTGKN